MKNSVILLVFLFSSCLYLFAQTEEGKKDPGYLNGSKLLASLAEKKTDEIYLDNRMIKIFISTAFSKAKNPMNDNATMDKGFNLIFGKVKFATVAQYILKNVEKENLTNLCKRMENTLNESNWESAGNMSMDEKLLYIYRKNGDSKKILGSIMIAINLKDKTIIYTNVVGEVNPLIFSSMMTSFLDSDSAKNTKKVNK